MFRRDFIHVWIGIFFVAGMFLMGQETWPPPCTDLDEDGYGDPASASCTFPEPDCDDSDPNMNPGIAEASFGDGVCDDGLDNDCDGQTDTDDPGCWQCRLLEDCDDGNPCTDEYCLVGGTCFYINNENGCEDGDPCTVDDVCSGGVCMGGDLLDEDGDGHVAEACGGDDCDDGLETVYPGAPELCDGIDNQCPGEFCYGEIDAHCDGSTPGMAPIPCGCFEMGDHFLDSWSQELPVHDVCISAFEMDVHEVTNAEYAECVDDGGCSLPLYLSSSKRASYYGDPLFDDFPVTWVNWHQAEAYCEWAGKRLPTEAEWEYAARGGLAGRRYAWGDTIFGTDANYWLSGDPWDNDTSQVEYYAPNGYGLYDVAGNVGEWTHDWYGKTYYQYCVDNSMVNNPTGPEEGTYRVMRGGNWYFSIDLLTVSRRYGQDHPDFHNPGFGIRCARGGAFGP